MAKKTAAKKPVTKKPRRRLKRTARRSLAAVLMITAVVVAAIPVPENVAAPEDYGISAHADDEIDVHEKDGYLQGSDGTATGANAYKPYKYDPDNAIDMPLGVANFDLNKYAGKTDAELVEALKNDSTLYASLKVSNPEGSTYSLGWEFMYYDVANPRGGMKAGAICKYNTEYYDEPTLNLFPNTEYFTATAYDVATYFNGNLSQETVTGSKGQPLTGYVIKNGTNVTQVMDNDPAKGEKIYTYEKYVNNNNAELEEFLKRYPSINNKYIDVKAKYDKYKTDKEAWENDKNNVGVYPVTVPDDFVVKPKEDLNEADQWKYFCDHNLQVSSNDEYTLVPAKDNRPGGAQGDIYLAKGTAGNAGEEGSKSDNDKFGFLVLKTSKYQMCAIANKAFYGTENVKNITIPDQIGYIGDDAFAGSKLEGVSFANVTAIGNRAFKGCVVLKVAQLELTVERVGNECFSGTKIEQVKFGSGLKEIGYGAFGGCNSLTTVKFEDKGSDAKIGGYAFYNCSELTEVSMKGANIVQIGDGAFASDAGSKPMGFTLSDRLTGPGSIGNYLFAGRSNLKYVDFPGNYANSTVTKTKIPPAMFHGCIYLERVTFPTEGNPTACGFVEYDSKILFADVINKDFYVEGPENNSSNQKALPRKSTWGAITAVSNTVPYLYHQGEGANKKDFWEVSDGFYLLSVNGSEGILKSCTLKPDADLTKWNGVLDIPKKVGDTPIKGIGENCFTDSDLNSAVKYIRIPDDSIESIADGVFKGGTDGKTDWLNLKEVYIGNSVKSIGVSAFEGCTALTDIFLNSPKVAHKDFVLGENAFKTGSKSGLTIHGDIATDYAPYTWAMGGTQDSWVRPDGLRACYKSLAPDYLTVIYDNNTKLATLMDYPKEKEVSKILDEAYKFDIMAGPDGSFENPYKNYVEMRKAQSYAKWSDGGNDFRRDAFKQAWMAAKTDEERAAVYDSENYGPWVNTDFVADSDTWPVAAPGGGGGTGGGGAMNKAADFFFEPIVAHAADKVYAYYDPAGPRKGKYEIGVTDPTDTELRLLEKVREIDVPAGVDSIDVYSYAYGVKSTDGTRTGRENNEVNRQQYFGSAKMGDSWDMYTSSAGQEESDPTRVVPGLFSGDYDDGLGVDSGEKFRRGNDKITSVTLGSVTYLPDYAFDSCENLLSVDLGPKCSDIGVAPFRGCYEMETVGDNEWYTTTKGIIYSKNTDGSLTIEECLSARGRKIDTVGPPIVSAGKGDNDGDSNLKKVSAIKPGAFEDCDDLTEIRLGKDEEDTSGLKVIPDDCFKNSDVLQTVVLPITVNDIGPGAFVGAKNLRDLTIYGDEVKISGSAFDGNKVQTTVHAPEDSAVVRYVKEYGKDYKLVMSDEPFGKQWKVTFYDANYQVIKELKDGLGNKINNPQRVTNGDPIPKIPANPEMEGWTFDEWIGLNGATVQGPITEDTIFYAKGHYNSGAPINGQYTVEFIDGMTGEQLVGKRGFNPADGKYYVDAGKTFTEMKYSAPEHRLDETHKGYEDDGYKFNNVDTAASEEWTVETRIKQNMTVAVAYKATAGGGTTSGGSTNTPTSGGTTNTPTSGGTTSNTSTSSSSSSSKSSSSSSSGSSTSTTSTTNTSGAGMYTVFVENGYGSGSYAPGTMVIVTAAQPAAGMRFDKWTTESNGVTLVSVSLPATTFLMPANNVSVKANFVEDTAPRATSAPGGGSGSNTGGGTTNDNGNTRVDIEKPGISNRDLATANVNGSTDNFIVKISETDEATRAVAAALTNKYGTLDNILYYAMDISLYDSTGTTKISDTTGLTVDITIPIPDSLVAYGGNNMAGAVVSGDQLESLNENFTTINGVPCIRFRATHFSPYTIYVDTGNLVEGMLDTTPKTGDPIHPKWFLSLGLACLSMILFLKRDKKRPAKVKA